MRLGSLVALLAVLLFSSCGGAGGDLPRSSDVIVTVTPTTATIAPGGTLVMNAQTSGYTSAPFLDWWMQEQHDHYVSGSEDCDDIQPANANLIAGCAYGYITVNSMNATDSTATYTAPSTPGTYHVKFRSVQMSSQVFGGSVEKDVTVTINVR